MDSGEEKIDGSELVAGGERERGELSFFRALLLVRTRI